MRCSIHIDAGYLYSALATRETGSANRAAINVDEAAMVRSLVEMATADSELRLLRVLWYDAAKDGVPDAYQRRIGLIDSVKLRMGRINPFGEQKGVDLRLGLDLVSLGVNCAAEVAYLVSGDDDLAEAVTDAQDLGLQVKLIVVTGVDGRAIAVAHHLSLAVDGMMTIPESVIAATVSRVTRSKTLIQPTVPSTPPRPIPGPVAAGTAGTTPLAKRPTVTPPPTPSTPPVRPRPAPIPVVPLPIPVYSSSTGMDGAMGETSVIDRDLIDEVAQSVFTVWATTANGDELDTLLAGRPNIPPQIDRILLADMVTRSGRYDIPTYARFDMREAFWNAASKHVE